MIKWIGEKGKEWALILFKNAWKYQTISQGWKKNLITHIYRKVDQTLCDNYRAICLLVSFKIYTGTIEQTLRRYVEGKLEDKHSAFRTRRQINNIFIIGRLMQKIRKHEIHFI